MRLEGKVALMTGGTSGIGRATAILFAREGAAVAITGRNEERGGDVVAEIQGLGGRGIFMRAEVQSAEDCRRTVEETVRAFGSLDILFNNVRCPSAPRRSGIAPSTSISKARS
jgi:NAD(P)-dependent dehydrogenase (short-subunit alcohol dehydrogenase family)